jgi:hypothetical protein
MTLTSLFAFVSTAIIAKLKLPVGPTAPKLKSKDQIIAELEDRVDHLHLMNKALREEIRLERGRFKAREGVLIAQRDLAAQQAREAFAGLMPPPIPVQRPSQAQDLLRVQSIEAMLNLRVEDPGHWASCTCVPARGDVLMPRRRAF